MSTDREITRIVRSWLEEGATALPDRVLDAVLDQVPATPQRRPWWPARRYADMNNMLKVALSAAAVVAVAVVGISLLARIGGPGGRSADTRPDGDAGPVPEREPRGRDRAIGSRDLQHRRHERRPPSRSPSRCRGLDRTRRTGMSTRTTTTDELGFIRRRDPRLRRCLQVRGGHHSGGTDGRRPGSSAGGPGGVGCIDAGRRHAGRVSGQADRHLHPRRPGSLDVSAWSGVDPDLGRSGGDELLRDPGQARGHVEAGVHRRRRRHASRDRHRSAVRARRRATWPNCRRSSTRSPSSRRDLDRESLTEARAAHDGRPR